MTLLKTMLSKRNLLFLALVSLFTINSQAQTIHLTKFDWKTKTYVDTTYQASRLLTQTTFGPTYKSIDDLMNYETYENWIDNQIALKPTKIYDIVHQYPNPKDINRTHNTAYYRAVLTQPDQLRQRVGFAYSEIFVALLAKSNFRAQEKQYYDILSAQAFGNFRTLLEEITLSPVMGHYLDMLGNKKGNIRRNTHPDENYAREIMQLFTIGLNELNLDGTLTLDNEGQPIPTYTQKHIEGTAAALTGFGFIGSKDYTKPMKCRKKHHETKEKIIVGDVIIPANQSCEDDLKMVLDTLFNHSNVAPFISKQLIQKLITSNPTPQYVQRVASIFEDNGKGIRGDMEAVIKTILTDDEALYGHITLPLQFGKIKEPLIRLTTLYRNIESTNNSGFNPIGVKVHQSFQRAPDVFSFFRPNYTEPGILSDNGMVAPELQIATEGNLIDTANGFYNIIKKSYKRGIHTDLSTFIDNVYNPEALVEQYNLLFMAGAMNDSMKSILINYIQSIQIPVEKELILPPTPILEAYVYNNELNTRQNKWKSKAHNRANKRLLKQYNRKVKYLKKKFYRNKKYEARAIENAQKDRIVKSMHLVLTSAQQALQQ